MYRINYCEADRETGQTITKGSTEDVQDIETAMSAVRTLLTANMADAKGNPAVFITLIPTGDTDHAQV